MAAKKLHPFVIFLMLLAVLGLAVTALRPVAAEFVLTWKLRSTVEAEWRPAAEALLERGSRRGLARAIETALVRDAKNFDLWQTKLFERRRRDVRWALPAYEAGLRHEDAAVRRAALGALHRNEWRRPEAVPVLARALESPDPVLRWQAGYVLHAMGPGAHAAAPALIRAARDPEENVRWAAVYALGAMAPAAPDAVPALTRALGDPSVLVSSHAAGALAGFGARAAGAVPALLKALGASEPLLRVEAARALGSLGPAARSALPVLLETLRSWGDWTYRGFTYDGISPPEVPDNPPLSREDLRQVSGPREGRIELLHAILRLGADAPDVLPCLMRLADQPSHAMRQAAVTNLGRIGPRASAAVPDLIRSLAEREPRGIAGMFDESDTNIAAAEALGAIGPAATPALLRALASSDSRTRCGAARALGRIDPPGPESIAALRAALADGEFAVRLTAAMSLKRFEPGASVLPSLLEAAAAGRARYKPVWKLVHLDGLVGKEALPCLPRLREALTQKGSIPAAVAARLLASMAREAPEPLEDLFAALETTDRSLRLEVVRVLGGLTGRAEEVVPRLARVVEHDPDRDIRLRAAASLSTFGVRAKAALPALRAGYRAPGENRDRRHWLDAIVAISPGDPEAIDLRLRDAAGDWDVSAALDLLAKAGPPARSLLSAAERFLEHDDLEVRLKAAHALWALDRRVDPGLAIAREALADHWCSWQWSQIFFQLSLRPLPPPAGWRNPAREDAARLLSEMGATGKPAVPELIACLDFPGHTVRILAAEALWRVTGDLRLDVIIEAVEASLPDLARDPTYLEPFMAEALRVLGELGPAARGALPALERLRAAAPAGPLRAAAEEALRKIAGQDG